MPLSRSHLGQLRGIARRRQRRLLQSRGGQQAWGRLPAALLGRAPSRGPGATRTPCPHAPAPARAFLSVPGAPLLRPSSGPLQTELQHESATLRADAAAALALLDCGVWSATDAASRREGARRRQHALLGAAQSFEDWTWALAGRQEEIPQTAPPSLP